MGQSSGLSSVEEKLQPYFTPLPKQEHESIFAYLWARTVACPSTGKPVPLSPNWWLSKNEPQVAVQVIAEEDMQVPEFKILRSDQLKSYDPDEGTVSRGVGKSPWTGETIPGDYIKAEAQAGRMSEMLYAIATKTPHGFEFREPSTPQTSRPLNYAKEELD
jgi:putative DNA methylase